MPLAAGITRQLNAAAMPSPRLSLPSPRGLPRAAILAATQSPRAARFGRRFGMRLGASRFVAGETLDDCVAVLRQLHERGLRSYAIVLGENVTDREAIASTVRVYQDVARRVGGEGIGATMALKLTHLGLVLDEDLALENAVSVLTTAASSGVFIRIDMESSAYIDPTLRIYRELRRRGIDNTGVVIQAYLRRAESDLQSLKDLRPNVRLVKGAYLEPSHVAFSDKAEVDANYKRLVDLALGEIPFTAVATHDDAMLRHAAARIHARPADCANRYEFQLLYGIRPHLQARLAADGHPVRVCVPFGSDWYVYFGRRLAERPANVLFVARSLVRR